jgi:hypothetical protein
MAICRRRLRLSINAVEICVVLSGPHTGEPHHPSVCQRKEETSITIHFNRVSADVPTHVGLIGEVVTTSVSSNRRKTASNVSPAINPMMNANQAAP